MRHLGTVCVHKKTGATIRIFGQVDRRIYRVIETKEKDMAIYLGNDPEPELIIHLTESEYQKIPPRGSWSRRVATVTDSRTGKKYAVRRASCGLPNCRCALVLAK